MFTHFFDQISILKFSFLFTFTLIYNLLLIEFDFVSLIIQIQNEKKKKKKQEKIEFFHHKIRKFKSLIWFFHFGFYHHCVESCVLSERRKKYNNNIKSDSADTLSFIFIYKFYCFTKIHLLFWISTKLKTKKKVPKKSKVT